MGKRFRSLIIGAQKSYQGLIKTTNTVPKKWKYLFDSGWLRCCRHQHGHRCIVARRFARSNISWFRYWSLPVHRIFIYHIFLVFSFVLYRIDMCVLSAALGERYASARNKPANWKCQFILVHDDELYFRFESNKIITAGGAAMPQASPEWHSFFRECSPFNWMK